MGIRVSNLHLYLLPCLRLSDMPIIFQLLYGLTVASSLRNAGMRERLGLLLKQRRLSRDDIKAVLQVRLTALSVHPGAFGSLNPGASVVGIMVNF